MQEKQNIEVIKKREKYVQTRKGESTKRAINDR